MTVLKAIEIMTPASNCGIDAKAMGVGKEALVIKAINSAYVQNQNERAYDCNMKERRVIDNLTFQVI